MGKRIQVADSTYAAIKGETDLTSWDREELIRGRRRDRHGYFTGRPPTVMPRNVYLELRRRTMAEVYEEVRSQAIPAAQALGRILSGEEEPDPTRLRAIQEVLNRFIGKPPERVEMSSTDARPYEELLDDIERDLDPDEEMIDVEFIDGWDADLIDDE